MATGSYQVAPPGAPEDHNSPPSSPYSPTKARTLVQVSPSPSRSRVVSANNFPQQEQRRTPKMSIATSMRRTASQQMPPPVKFSALGLEVGGGQSPTSQPALSPKADFGGAGEGTEKGDAFEQLIRQLEKEHRGEVARLQQDNKELKDRLDAVLTSTWNLDENGWNARPPRAAADQPASLSLVRAKSKDARGKSKEELHKVDSEVAERQRNRSRYHIRMQWKGNDGMPGVKLKGSLGNLSQMALMSSGELNEDAQQYGSGCVLLPFGAVRLCWDVLSMVFLMWDVVMVPLSVFSPPETAFTRAGEWVTLVFWTLDILVSFHTGYYSKNTSELVTDLRLIGKKYLRGRFLFDCIIVVPDWIVKLLKGFALIGSAADQYIQFIILLRCTRLAKLWAFWLMIKDRIESDLVFAVPRMTIFISIVVLASHFMGALWYLVGLLCERAEMDNWIAEIENLSNASVALRYFTSLQWCMSNFALVTTDVYPTNSYERSFAALVMIVGLFTFLWGTSTFTSALEELKNIRGDTGKEFWLLRRYLRQHKVSETLARRVMHYAEGACTEQMKRVGENRVKLLPMLSDQLRSELKCAVSYAALFVHPLMESVKSKSKIMEGLANECLSRKAYGAGEVISVKDAPTTSMCVVISGELYYVQGSSERKLGHGDWLCEAVLWVLWSNRGTTNAATSSDLIMVEPKSFAEVMKLEPPICGLMSAYAMQYVDWLNSEATVEITDVGDSSLSVELLEKCVHDEDCGPTEEQRVEARRIFDVLDADGGGTLDAEELRDALMKRGQFLTMDDSERMVAEVDEDGDGAIDFEEFVNLLCGKGKSGNSSSWAWAFRVFSGQEETKVQKRHSWTETIAATAGLRRASVSQPVA